MKSLTKIVLFFICLTFSTTVLAQSVTNETNIWYFGLNAGLNFNTSPPTPLLDGALSTLEGSASISDKFGNLLFYTDGITVWDKTHQVMPNGTGLLGHPSSAQSGIVIPKPGSSTFFYLITVPEDETDGMRYSEIDITLNGGLGDVVPATKNTLMFLNSSEKVTAVKHANKLYYWVVGRKKTGSASKTYVSFLIDCDGFHIDNPIESNVGITNGENWGYLIADPNGKKLASASEHSGIEITDFNNITGVVSNPIFLGTPNQSGSVSGSYGVSFSSDGKVLYATNILDWSLFQWDMTASNIPLTQYYVGSTAGNGSYGYKGGALQLASDGKIYMAQMGYNTLGVIHSPNTLGSGCNFETNAIPLGGRRSQLGLPPFVTEYFNHDSLIVYENHCLGGITEFDISGDGITYLDSIKWNFDDPASGSENTSTIQNPTHVFSGPGVYHVELLRFLSCIADTSYRTITIYEQQFVDEDVVMCENGTYTLPDGTIVSEPGDYTSLISSWISGCDSTVYSHLTYPEVEFDAGEDHYICKGDSAQLNLSHFGNAINYNWTPAATLSQSTISNPKASPPVTTTYIVSAQSQVADNLIENGDFEQGDTLFDSEYESVPQSSNITPRGRYKVHSASPANWPGNCGDHTTGSGNMLMAWGSNGTGGFDVGANVWCQTVRTVPGLDYIFSAWFANIRSSGNSTSELTLFINGNMVAQSNIGGNCEWSQLIATYSAINQNDTIVELCIAEIGGNDIQNYFAIDDISFFQTCTLQDTVTVFVSDPVFDDILIENATCFDGTEGSIDTEVSGGFEPYTFSWDSGENTSLIENLSAGDYILTVTDSVQCVIDTLLTVTQPDILELTLSLDNIVWCDEVNTGGATVTIVGGTPDYTISWDNSETTASATQLPDGESIVTVSDANGCSATASITIDKQGTPDVTVSADILTVCQGEEATLSAGGATTYSWSPTAGLNISTGEVVIATPSATTTYTVIGTDDVGCENTAEITITVYESPEVVVSGDDVCEGASTVISASGATTYTWNNGLGSGASHTVSPTTTTTYAVSGVDGNGCENTNSLTINVHELPTVLASDDEQICENETTTISVSGGITYTWDNALGEGDTFDVTPTQTTTYSVTGTDINGCENTDEVTITVNPLPSITISTANTEICIGESTTLSASGATTYTWSPATGLNTTTSDEVIATPTETTTYTVTGFDDIGCANSEEITITVNQLPEIEVSGDDICAQGSTVISASGATTYTWDNGLGNGASHTVSPTAPTIYSVIGTDGNGCESTDEITIVVHSLPTIIASDDDIICEGESSSIYASGGISYEWDNALGEGEAFDITPTQTTTYTVTGTDINGCENTDEVTITVNPAPTISFNPDNTVLCIGESTAITVSGATTYSWSPATGLNTTVGDEVIAIPSETTTYTVTGFDDIGCANSEEITITVNQLPEIEVSGDDICAQGSTVISASGATTYTWDNGLGNGASHTVSPTQETTYSVTGIDGNGCENTNEITINVYSLPTIIASADAVICQNDSSVISASGGDTYEWDNALGEGQSFVVSPTQETTYTVTGTDINGCTNTAEVNIDVNPTPTGSISGNIVLCQGDEKPEIIFEGINSTGNLNFTYSVNGGTPETISSDGDNTAIIVFPTDLPGEYNFTLIEVEDPATGCSTIYTDTITILINPMPDATSSGSIVACVNDDFPDITFEGFNSSGEYTFTYNVGGPNEELTTNGTNTATVTIPTDSPGSYFYELVSVMDPETGCLNMINEEYTIIISTTPTATITEDAIVCQWDDEPLVTLQGEGGFSNYQFVYLLNGIENEVTTPDGVTSEVIEVSTDVPGTFTYTLLSVTDPATGCYTKYDDPVTIIVNQTPTATTGGSTVICEGDGSQVIYFTGTNSSSEYIFTYSQNGEDTLVYTTEGTNTLEFPISSSVPGDYSYTLFTVSDPATGCSSTINATETVTVGTTPIANFYANPEEVSNVNPTSQMVNTSENGSYYDWSFGDGTPNSDEFSPFHDFPNQHSETYNIMLIAYSAEGCSDTAYRYVEYIEELIFYVPNAFTPDGDPYNNEFKPVFSSGYDKQDYVLYIYNRWGELIFESRDTEIGWDGTYNNKLCPDGTYVWKIRVKNLREPESEIHVGHVTILR